MRLNKDYRVVSLLSYVITNTRSKLPTPENNTLTYFREQEIPENNVNKDTILPVTVITTEPDKYISAAGHLLGATQCTNAIIYPAMSIMAWHTNVDMPGIRTYYTYTEGRAIFRYYLDGKYYEDEDDAGWTARQFVIDPEKPLWHTIWTEKHRYAFGFNAPFKN